MREGYQIAALSGLLVCGTCGSRMSLAGNGKGNPDYRSFACSAHRSGKSCSSGLQISERRVTTALAETLRASFDHPAFRTSLGA